MGGKYTESQKKASLKYLQEKTDDIRIRAPKGTKERWREHAEMIGISLNQFIISVVEKEINKK